MLCCFPRESTPCERVREAGVEKRSWKKDEGSTGMSSEVTTEKATERREILERGLGSWTDDDFYRAVGKGGLYIGLGRDGQSSLSTVILPGKGAMRVILHDTAHCHPIETH